jgi:hypothetical protein
MSEMDFLTRLVNILPRLRNRFALTGLLIMVAAFVATRAVAPDAIQAQVSAGAIGVLFLVFGQVFHQLASFPAKDRADLVTRLFALFVVLIVALVTITGYFLRSAAGAHSAVNTGYLASLVGNEPFREALPVPMVSQGFSDALIADPGAARRLKAVQLQVSPDAATSLPFGSDAAVFAHLEIYSNREDAASRGASSRNDLEQRFDAGLDSGTDSSFCVSGVGGTVFWTCAGSRGFAYAEATLSPGTNAYRGIATGVVSALLNYSDKMTAIATAQS